MVENKTVIVVGAGASKEFGLPVGNELLDDIGKLLTQRSGYDQVNDDLIDRSLTLWSFDKHNPRGLRNKFYRASEIIVNALPLAISIDNLIDAHRGNEEIEFIGKIAIVRAILNAERNSKLFADGNESSKINFQKTKDTWLNLLFKIISENADVNEISERLSKFVFVVFNYDRCIEYFLYNALQSYYNINSHEAGELLREYLEIHHVYGSVGTLPWLTQGQSTGFGETTTPRQLSHLTNKVKTFTEMEGENGEAKIRDNIKSAKNILFLGFAFHKLNMEIIALGNESHTDIASTNYYGTAYGISDSNTEEILTQLNKIGGLKSHKMFIRNDLTCYQLFNEYWRKFSLTNI